MATFTAGNLAGYTGYASGINTPFPPPLGSISDAVTSFGTLEEIYDFGNPEKAVTISSPSGTPDKIVIDGQDYDLTLDNSFGGLDYYLTTGTPAGHPTIANGVSYTWALATNSTYTLTVDAGLFSLSGGAATFRNTHILPAGEGSFTLSGGAVTFTKAKGFDAAPGTFALAGGDVSIAATRLLPAATGSFALTGGAATLRKGQTLFPDSGIFALTGGEATFRYNFLSADPGLFTLTGGTANIERSWVMVPDGSPADWASSADNIPPNWSAITDTQPSQWVLGG